jgi:hypothetical protein
MNYDGQNENHLQHEKETSEILNCAFEIINTLGHGLDHEIGQMLNYLKITGLPVGLILNFKRSRLEWKRVINQYPKS